MAWNDWIQANLNSSCLHFQFSVHKLLFNGAGVDTGLWKAILKFECGAHYRFIMIFIVCTALVCMVWRANSHIWKHDKIQLWLSVVSTLTVVCIRLFFEKVRFKCQTLEVTKIPL